MILDGELNAEEASNYFPVFNFNPQETLQRNNHFGTHLTIPNGSVDPSPLISHSLI